MYTTVTREMSTHAYAPSGAWHHLPFLHVLPPLHYFRLSGDDRLRLLVREFLQAGYPSCSDAN